MATNVVTAVFGASRVVRTRALYQWDYGQILQFEGLDLPAAYTVHFSNQGIQGTAKTQVGNADGVTIPDEYLTTGQTVYAWVFLHAGEDDGETMYAVIIPVTARPQPTEDEPTPVQQGVIDQAIAALNAGVEDVQEAVEGVQDAIDTALQEAKASGEFNGEDGVSPTVDVTEITGGHRVSVTDAEGTESFDVMDGEPGADGLSPSARVEQTSIGATVTVTDKQGTTSANLTNGEDGISPTITITDITGGHRVTITDATGPHSFDVMDGDSGDAPVQDVQVNGTSVVTDGVANVPVAGSSRLGVLKAMSEYGIGVFSTGDLYIQTALEAEVKGGTVSYRSITPVRQHLSTFYGLAKAAGSDEKNSILPVGQYTEAAKVAIQKMLGVYEEPFRLIYENTVTEETGAINIISDIDSNPFSLQEILVLFDRVVGSATSTGGVIVNNGSAGSNAAYIAVRALYNPTPQTRSVHIQIIGGRMFGDTVDADMSTVYWPVAISTSKNASGWIECGLINEITIGSLNGHKFTAGTITIYGR